ncbi:LysR family transcriptional regulator [Moritella viscosa]|uniref:LysR family transcriptional regulator n=1 Tax=Moritella viscosa TaxID=80854 RepID=UPI00406CB343
MELTFGSHKQFSGSQLANLDTFVKAAQHGSFTQAAEVLFLTPSAVTVIVLLSWNKNSALSCFIVCINS